MLQRVGMAQPGDVVTLDSPPDFVILDVGLVEGMEGREGLQFNPTTGGLLLSLKAQPEPDTKKRCLINGSLYKLTVCSFAYDMLFCVTIRKSTSKSFLNLLIHMTPSRPATIAGVCV